MEWQVWQVTDSDTVVARNKDEAIKCYADELGETVTPHFIENYGLEDVYPLDEVTMENRMIITSDGDVDENTKLKDLPRISFKDQLAKLIDTNHKLPCHFSTTEH